MGLTVWVDGDACPQAAREILYRAANRVEFELILVANAPLPLPRQPRISQLQVPSGFDRADQEIVERMQQGDLVITSDIPLAAEVVARQGAALSPRGELFGPDSIKARLNMRDFNETLRASGINTAGPPPYGAQDRKRFADQLDRWLAKRPKPSPKPAEQ